MVIHVEQVEPGRDVLALGRDLALHTVEELPRSGVGRRALFLTGRPGVDFRLGALVLGVLLNPFQHFAVALAGGKLPLERVGVDADETEEALVERAGVMVFPFLPAMVARPLSSMRGRMT